MEIDWADDTRQDEYIFTLVDPFSLSDIDTCDINAKDSSMTLGYYTDNYYEGSLNLESGTNKVENKTYLVRVKDHITIGDYAETFTLGTFFISSPSGSAKFGRIQRSAQGYSTIWRTTQNIIINDYQVRQGQRVVDHIKYLIEVDGGKFQIQGDNGLTINPDPDYLDMYNRLIGADKIYPLGTKIYDILYELADNIGCELLPDAEGRIVLRKNIPVQNREVKYIFQEGKTCTCLPGFSWDQVSTDMYNRVLCYYSTEEKTERVVVDLTPEDSFNAWGNIGIYQTAVIKKDEETSLDDMKREAAQYLKEHSTSAYDLTISHAFIPFLRPGDVVRYINDTDAGKTVNVICLVVEQSMNFTLGGMVQTKIRTFV